MAKLRGGTRISGNLYIDDWIITDEGFKLPNGDVAVMVDTTIFGSKQNRLAKFSNNTTSNITKSTITDDGTTVAIGATNITLAGDVITLGDSAADITHVKSKFYLYDSTDISHYIDLKAPAITSNHTLTLPIVTGTLAALNLAQSWSAVQTHTANIVTSGSAVLNQTNTGTTAVAHSITANSLTSGSALTIQSSSASRTANSALLSVTGSGASSAAIRGIYSTIKGTNSAAFYADSGKYSFYGNTGEIYNKGIVTLDAANDTGQLQITTGSKYTYVGTHSTGYGFVQSAQALVLQPTSGNVGIGVTAPKSKLDVSSVSIGTYAGVTAAPANSLIVSGTVSAGATTSSGTFTAAKSVDGEHVAFYGYNSSNNAAATVSQQFALFGGSTIDIAGKIRVAKEAAWTDTASSRDAKMIFSVIEDDILVDRMTLGSDGKLTVAQVQGNAATATQAYVTATSTAAAYPLVFASGSNSNQDLRSHSGLVYNPSAKTLTIDGTFIGDIARETVVENAVNLQGTTVFSVPYQSASKTTSYIPPNTANKKKWLRMTGTGSAGAAPVWDDIDVISTNLTVLAGVNVTMAAGSGTFSQAHTSTTATTSFSALHTGVKTANIDSFWMQNTSTTSTAGLTKRALRVSSTGSWTGTNQALYVEATGGTVANYSFYGASGNFHNAAAATFGSTVSITGVTTTANIVPSANQTRDLGSSSLQWSKGYFKDISASGVINDLTLTKGVTRGFTAKGNNETLTLLSNVTLGDATNTGNVTVRSSSTGNTTIIGPTGATATLVSGTMVPTSRTLTITTGNGVTGGQAAYSLASNRSWTLGLTGQALAFHNLSTTGIVARTAADTIEAREIKGTANRVTITNGTGVSGDPTIDIASNYVGQNTITTVGTIGTGTWSATTIAANKGGTGQNTYTVGDILYASSTSALSKLAAVAAGNALISKGVGTAPEWGKIALASNVSGTLPIANGGTGTTSVTRWGVVYGSTTTAYASTGAGTTGQYLRATTSGAPQFATFKTLTVNTTPAVSSVSVGNYEPYNTARTLTVLKPDQDINTTSNVTFAGAHINGDIQIDDSAGNDGFVLRYDNTAKTLNFVWVGV